MNEVMENKAELNSEYGKIVLGQIVTSCDICGEKLVNGGDEFKIAVNGKNYSICPSCAVKYTLADLRDKGIIPDIASEYNEEEIKNGDIVCAETDSAMDNEMQIGDAFMTEEEKNAPFMDENGNPVEFKVN